MIPRMSGRAETTTFLLYGALILLWTSAAQQYVKAEVSTVSHRKFADDITNELYLFSSSSDGGNDGENHCSSTLGISMAFSLIYPASTGESENQIRSVFGYPQTGQSSSLVWADASASLDATYEGRCTDGSSEQECYVTEPLVEIANRIYVRNDVALESSYQQVVGDFVQELDFADVDAGGAINSWVNDTTKGLIDSIVQDGPLPSNWILVAINSIYMKASWLWSFNEGKTTEDEFYVNDGRTSSSSQAHFMHQVEYFPYSHTAVNGLYQILQLPFAGGEASLFLSMIFVVPTSTTSSPAATSTDVIGALPMLEMTKVAMAIPKFKYESKYENDLMDALKAVGIVAPFEGGLCVRQGGCGAAIDVVIQKTFIDVNEKGVEAAAVTLIGVDESAPPPDAATLVLVNRPFQFFIYDSNQDVVLFEGLVNNPGIPDGSSATATSSSHTENSFWKDEFYIDPPIRVSSSAPPLPLPPTTAPTTNGPLLSQGCKHIMINYLPIMLLSSGISLLLV